MSLNIHRKKAKLSLCLTNYALSHKDVWGSECINPPFLNLGTRWRWVVNSTTLPLYPRWKSPGTTRIGGWVGPRVGLDNVEKRKFLTLPVVEHRPLGRSVRRQSLYRLRYPVSQKISVQTSERYESIDHYCWRSIVISFLTIVRYSEHSRKLEMTLNGRY
jgi:hypothetical protein